MERSELWKRTLGAIEGVESTDLERLRDALRKLRARVANMVAGIGQELPGLTVHDITHLDALWHVGDEVLGKEYPLNPAEAFVLGGAILLHDAAHATAAYAGGVAELKGGAEWWGFVALGLGGIEAAKGSEKEKIALFHILRELHAKQAERLPWVAWRDSSGNDAYLVEDVELREYFGRAIGLVAASHHWDVGMVPELLNPLMQTPAGFLKSSKWEVDILKLAMIMRIIDAAHIDSERAPWFLFALKNPDGISKEHWRFQGKIGRLTRNDSSELVVAGSAFKSNEQVAWWLAFDAATMIDSEIKGAQRVLAEYSRAALPVVGVCGVHSASSFSKSLPVSGWIPIDVRPNISDVPYLIERLGGSALYGNKPWVAVRELLQNAIDACTAYESLVRVGGRSIELKIVPGADGDWVLSVQDNGIGMSRYVLTNVLMDFGKSLWSSGDVMSELPGLTSSGFVSGGKFGIGFYSVFMLGANVCVVSRRFEKVDSDASDQWMLSFSNGLRSRPSLQIPGKERKLVESGTNLSIAISSATLLQVLGVSQALFDRSRLEDLACRLIRRLVPASPYDVDFIGPNGKFRAVSSDDWKSIDSATLLARFTDSDEQLWGLHRSDGELIGRVRPANRYRSESVGVMRGVVASEYSGLMGLVNVSGNNRDARRNEAPPHAILADWKRWAEVIISESPPLNTFELAALNALLPHIDMAVWRYCGENICLGVLKGKIAAMDTLVVHVGPIEHDDNDDMSSWRFERDFAEYDMVLIAPHEYYLPGGEPYFSSKDEFTFPWFLGVERVDYMGRLNEAIREVWGNVEEEEDDSVEVGSVFGAEIYRNCIVYRRVATA